jgi:hypothetical protein
MKTAAHHLSYTGDEPLSERLVAKFVLRMMILVLALPAMGLVACDKKAKLRDTLFVAPELQPFVSKFEEEALKQGRSLKIKNLHAQFTDKLEYPATGECNASEGTPVVRISLAFWQTASDASKQVAMFHELGHCILERPHDDAVIFLNGQYIPRTLMIASELDSAVFLANYDYYMQELFSVLP